MSLQGPGFVFQVEVSPVVGSCDAHMQGNAENVGPS